METNLKTVRGVRVVQALNEDSTYPGLYTNIQRAFPHTQKRQHATGPIAITRMRTGWADDERALRSLGYADFS